MKEIPYEVIQKEEKVTKQKLYKGFEHYKLLKIKFLMLNILYPFWLLLFTFLLESPLWHFGLYKKKLPFLTINRNYW